MFTSNIVLSSGKGGVPTVSTEMPTVVEKAGADIAARPANSGEAGYSAAPDPVIQSALAKIIETVTTMQDGLAKPISLSALEEYARNGDAGARQIAENVRAAMMTKKSLVEEMKTGNWLTHAGRADRAANVEMVTALRNETASVLDLEEIGLRSKGIYTTHFTTNGEFAGVSAEIEADFDAIARFQDKTFIRHDDGTMTDKATGRNANFVQDGHKFLYVIWP